ncbi:hypothetical protein QR680_017355 [Steinernema hermaphroditum]|uniref:Uncharacterized protein n=1 Tax=Steinernema hermaphroditum TaxID=289476 RepID=A0AA39HFF0_9BILA|nr:hypothetical protein QR680_017355 [Steinernema hermaphroditum]
MGVPIASPVSWGRLVLEELWKIRGVPTGFREHKMNKYLCEKDDEALKEVEEAEEDVLGCCDTVPSRKAEGRHVHMTRSEVLEEMVNNFQMRSLSPGNVFPVGELRDEDPGPLSTPREHCSTSPALSPLRPQTPRPIGLLGRKRRRENPRRSPEQVLWLHPSAGNNKAVFALLEDAALF